jgi:hypothetical protein
MLAITEDGRRFGSDYLRWAKTHAPARYDLTSSGVPFYELRDLPVTLDDLELSGSGGYGYDPLLQAIAARYRVPRECVVSAMGTSMANHLAYAALLQPGDEVLIEHPAYDPLPSLARQLGITVRRCAPWARWRGGWARRCWWTRCTWTRSSSRSRAPRSTWAASSSSPAA